MGKYDAFHCFMLKRQYEIKLSLLGKSILEDKLSPNLEKYSQGIKYNYIPFFGICFSTLLSECSVFGIPQSFSFHKDFQTGNVALRTVPCVDWDLLLSISTEENIIFFFIVVCSNSLLLKMLKVAPVSILRSSWIYSCLHSLGLLPFFVY